MSQGPHEPPEPGDNHNATGGQPGGADYGWLYGADPNVADDDATRVMPTIPRDALPPVAPPVRTQPNPILAPRARPARRPRIRWRRVITIFVVLPLIAWLAFLLAVPLISWNKIDRVSAFPSGARPATGQGTNYLLVGSDSRRGLTASQMQKLGVGGVSVDGGRTDTIMILHLGSGPATLLSIPRDSWVPIPGHGSGKINSAFAYGGPSLLVQTIENSTGLRIDHYVEIGLGGFVQAVDAVGGVRICPTNDVVDVKADLNIKKGCQTADGATALAWSRSRDAFSLGDLARGEHQREIVKDVGNQAKSPSTFLLPWRYLAINHAAVAGLTIDRQMHIGDMVSFARAMSSVSVTCSMPLAGFGNPLHWDRTKALALIDYFKNDNTATIPTTLCTPSGLPQ